MPATTTELTGVIRDGRVELDAPAAWPDGTRVRFVPVHDDVENDDYGPPDEPRSSEEELELLRQSIADAKAGIGLVPYEEAMDELRREMGFAPIQRKERP